MSIFEDVLEVHYNAENRVSGRRNIHTLQQALDEVGAPPEDVSVVLDRYSIGLIAAPLDADPELRDHSPVEYVDNRPERIALVLDPSLTIHGIGSSNDFALIMEPRAVRYDNTIADESGVVAIDFTDE